jgi:N-acetylneuraminic acid mutarotase
MKVLIYILVTFFFITGYAQSYNSWDSVPDFTAGQRERSISFSLNDKGYIGCGKDTADKIHKDLWRFDPSNQLWTQMSDMPGSTRRNAVAFVINDFAYVGTGADSATAPSGDILSDFWKYSYVNNSWVAITDYPGGGGNGVYFATAFSSSDKGYVCGGKVGPDSYLDELWEYKPVTDQWIQRADFPGGERYQLASFCARNKGYVGLGANEDVYVNDWWEYEIITNTWTQKNNFPAAERGGVTTFVIRNQGFICLGTDGGFKDDLWEYNHYSDSWTSRNDYPGSGRKFASAFVIQDTAYVGLGSSASGKKRSLHKYLPMQSVMVEEYGISSIKVYPNPVSEYFVLSGENLQYERISIINLSGREMAVFVKEWNHTYYLNSVLSPGVYFIVVSSENNVLSTQKIIKYR